MKIIPQKTSMLKEIDIEEIQVSYGSGLFKTIFGQDEFSVTYEVINGYRYFNATELIRQYNSNPSNTKKLLKNFRNRERTKDLIRQICPIKKAIVVKGKGRDAVTWIDHNLFKHFMIWLDVRYEIAVVNFIEQVERRMTQAVCVRKLETRHYKTMQKALKPICDGLAAEGSRGAGFFNVTINKKLHKKATGRPMPKGGTDHDRLTEEEALKVSILRHSVIEWAIEASEATSTAREARSVLYDKIDRARVEPLDDDRWTVALSEKEDE